MPLRPTRYQKVISASSLVRRIDAVETPGGWLTVTLQLEPEAKAQAAAVCAAIVAAVDGLTEGASDGPIPGD